LSEYRDLLAECQRLLRAIHRTQGIVDRTYGARRQPAILADGLQGQTSIGRKRFAWLIAQLDALVIQLRAFATNGL
jgi:hypothetical protein